MSFYLYLFVSKLIDIRFAKFIEINCFVLRILNFSNYLLINDPKISGSRAKRKAFSYITKPLFTNSAK